jgi:hypothetical protein
MRAPYAGEPRRLDCTRVPHWEPHQAAEWFLVWS